MTILLIDVTADPPLVALQGALGSITSETITSTRQLAEQLLPKIDQLLRARNLSSRQLSAVAVVNVPTSFTSLRIAISVANALAYAHSLPLVELTEQLPPVVAFELTDARLQANQTVTQLQPRYGRAPRITLPKQS